MALRGIAPDNEHQPGLFDVTNGAGIATIAHGAKETRGCGRLAVAGAVIHVIGPNNRARELLHQIAFFIRTL